MKFVLIKVVLPLAVLFGGIAYMGYLVQTRPQAPQTPREDQARLVEVAVVERGAEAVAVHAVGRVRPAREGVLQAEVTGRVVEVHPKLTMGGVLREGEVALRVDDRDYAIAVQQQRAQVTRARFELQVEQGQRRVATREWDLLSDSVETSDDGRRLALREPHLELARANLQAARSALERATLNEERAVVRVPFNAYVRAHAVEPGMIASPQAQLAQLVGTDVFWVEAAVPLDMVGMIAIPGVDGFTGERGAAVKIVHETGGAESIVREGYVVRLLAELDSLGAQARVLVAVEDPLLLEPHNQGRGLPLMFPAFVKLEIAAQAFDDVARVPRGALRDGDQVWVMSDDGKLEFREVEVVWRERESVLVRAGLATGERVVTSRIASAVPGMPVRVAAEPAVEAGAGDPGAAAAEAGLGADGGER